MMGGMRGVEGARKVLGGEEVEVTVDREDLGLGVEVVNSRGVVGAGDEAETFVLYELETVNGGGRVVGVNDGSRVVEKGSDHRFEGLGQTLLV